MGEWVFARSQSEVQIVQSDPTHQANRGLKYAGLSE
jgi:hypothetical protein